MPSKNRKKSWKNIHTSKEVDNYFSNVNYDIRFGGSITSRPDSQLFKLSKTPNDPVPSLSGKKVMKSWSHLYPDLSIPPIKQPVRPDTTNNTSRPFFADLRKKVVAIKHGRVQLPRGRKSVRANKWEMFRESLWRDEDAITNRAPDSGLSAIEDNLAPRLKIPNSVSQGRSDKKHSLLPAVLLPHPGISYQPKEEEHTQLLESVKTGEERRLRGERRLKRSLRGMRHLSKKDIAREERRQMREGLFGESKLDSESEDLTPAVATVRRQKVKKKKMKGLSLERRRALLELEKRKLETRHAEDIQNIKSLNKRLDRQATFRRKPRSAPLTKRLGKLRYNEPMRDFQLRSEIASNLGRLVPEGNLLRDRYKSLQKRNIIEVRRRRIMKRKYKLKAYLKNSFKENT